MRVILVLMLTFALGESLREKRSVLYYLLKGFSLSNPESSSFKTKITSVDSAESSHPHKLSKSENNVSPVSKITKHKQRKFALQIGNEFIKSVVLKITGSDVKVMKTKNAYNIEIGNEVPKAKIEIELPNSNSITTNFTEKDSENELSSKLIKKDLLEQQEDFSKRDSIYFKVKNKEPKEENKNEERYQLSEDEIIKPKRVAPSSFTLQQTVFLHPDVINQEFDKVYQTKQRSFNEYFFPMSSDQQRQVENERVLRSLWKKNYR